MGVKRSSNKKGNVKSSEGWEQPREVPPPAERSTRKCRLGWRRSPALECDWGALPAPHTLSPFLDLETQALTGRQP